MNKIREKDVESYIRILVSEGLEFGSEHAPNRSGHPQTTMSDSSNAGTDTSTTTGKIVDTEGIENG